MAIYRGSGGAGDATGDATNASQLALAAADEAQASASSAASSATNAANSASAAATDAIDAATSETNAAGSASDALASENAAANSASDAADSAAAAATSATNAASSASTASTQATNASNSASSASTSASNASTSATSASTSATNASNSATSAASSATAAAASAVTAATFDPALYLPKAGNLSGIANAVTAANNLGINPYGNGFKNRLINSDMRIDQRNAGASVSYAASSSGYNLDRWAMDNTTDGALTVQEVFTSSSADNAPAGFINSLKISVTTADASLASSQRCRLYQRVEGLNCADFNWGSANAQAVTVSFWVKSSLTGTFGGAVRNSAANRSYAFSYTISAANTWEQKNVTIAGDIAGTWLTTNGVGLELGFGLGAASDLSGTAGTWTATANVSATGATSVIGTVSSTFYITGVQLEKGSTATSFDYRPYGTELALCQRYYMKSDAYIAALVSGVAVTNMSFAAPMRTSPTVAGGGAGFATVVSSNNQVSYYQTSTGSGTLTFSAEL